MACNISHLYDMGRTGDGYIRGGAEIGGAYGDDRGYRHPDISGTVICIKNENGGSMLLQKHEISDVLEDILDKIIEQKDIDLYKKININLSKHIDKNIEILDVETKKYFHDKIDKVAEDIAIRMLDSEIEKQIRIRVEAKLDEMRKLL